MHEFEKGYNNRQAEDQDENGQDIQKKGEKDRRRRVRRLRPARVCFRWTGYQ